MGRIDQSQCPGTAGLQFIWNVLTKKAFFKPADQLCAPVMSSDLQPRSKGTVDIFKAIHQMLWNNLALNKGVTHLAMREFLQGRTTLIIAHRLSAVRQADRALVFEGGTIVEDGSHDDLMRNDGLYASLYRHAESKEAF